MRLEARRIESAPHYRVELRGRQSLPAGPATVDIDCRFRRSVHRRMRRLVSDCRRFGGEAPPSQPSDALMFPSRPLGASKMLKLY